MDSMVFTKEMVTNSAIFRDRIYEIVDVDEENQMLFLGIPEIFKKTKGTLWVPVESISYIPF